MERNHTVDDYFDLLNAESGLILIGGQAVNLWAERYQATDPSISRFQPFTSFDADFYRIGSELRLPSNWTVTRAPRKGRMKLVTHKLQGPKGQPAEILQSVMGLTEEELKNGAISIEYEDDGRTWLMWFLPPPLLFQAKLENVRNLDQTDRQDLKHLKLLVPINRCFFSDLLEQVPSVGRAKKVMAWLQLHCVNVRKAIEQGYLAERDWEIYFPLRELDGHSNVGLRNFASHQLQAFD